MSEPLPSAEIDARECLWCTCPGNRCWRTCPACGYTAAAHTNGCPTPPAEQDVTCQATTFGYPTDDHVYVCGRPATDEWLDLTGQWSPVCEAHGRGRGVPQERLRTRVTPPGEPE